MCRRCDLSPLEEEVVEFYEDGDDVNSFAAKSELGILYELRTQELLDKRSALSH